MRFAQERWMQPLPTACMRFIQMLLAAASSGCTSAA
jgi:hypothetical protein